MGFIESNKLQTERKENFCKNPKGQFFQASRHATSVAYSLKAQVQKFFSFLCLYKCGIIYTRFLAFMSYTYNLLLFLLVIFLLGHNQKKIGYAFHVSCSVNNFFLKNNFLSGLI